MVLPLTLTRRLAPALGAVLLTLAASLPLPATAAETARNVILFIGDGMGLGIVHAAALRTQGQNLDARGEPPSLSFEKFPACGYLASSPSNTLVTDSAAAGTANVLTLMAGEVNRSDVERLAPQVTVEPLRGC